MLDLIKLNNWILIFVFRYKGEPEPDHEPSKLFKVTRVKKIFGLPHWEKRILRDMMLYGVS